LNKLGVVLLVMGVALFLGYEFGGSPAGRVFLGYLAGVASLGAGIWLERREPYRVCARSLIGGGWAIVFFVSYAIHFVAATRELTHPPMSLARLPDDQEVRMGSQLASEQATSAAPLTPEERAMEAYIPRVGERLARNAHRKLPYRFHYIPRKWSVNAYALPGGHVYLGAGLLQLMDTEDELAAVLGHEIEHIDHYHCAERDRDRGDAAEDPARTNRRHSHSGV
jgi:Zn-dependent protease with chaperone function